MKVLLAEDEPAVAASVAQQLTALGHSVVAEAATGREAVEMAARTEPEVVVMDIVMPDGDGIEAARRIAEQAPCPVVFLSGHFDEELLRGVAEAGGLGYLLKPATPDQLQAALTLAQRRFAEMADIRDQAAKLEQALAARKLVARAKGVLMERHGLSEQEAHRRMQKEASRSNLKLADLARAMLAADPLLRGSGRQEEDSPRASDSDAGS